MTLPSLLIISGPTASGKSALSIALAQAMDGEIVIGDSVQVYRGLSIGSAKVKEEERRGIPHHLLDSRDPDQEYHGAQFVADARAAISDIIARRKVPIVVGGTTMYLTMLLHGISQIPQGDSELRERFRTTSLEELRAELERCDPLRAAELHPHDRIRTERALEAFAMTGKTSSAHLAQHRFSERFFNALIIVLTPPRDTLYANIDHRVGEMMEEGIIEETEKICAQYGYRIPPLRSIGYAQVVEFLKGSMTREECSVAIATATRQYAKRQMTFWRNEPKKRGWKVTPEQAAYTTPWQHNQRKEIESQTISLGDILGQFSQLAELNDNFGVRVHYAWPWQ